MEKTREQPGLVSAEDPFCGGGEAGAILRAIDWSAKPIGPVARWPQSLRTALSICLSSRHPICIIWGPDRVYFYNDAHTPIVGGKHPRALGESYVTVWPEVWDSVIRPILEPVERTGQASWADGLLLVLQRHGFNEECYFAFSFSPTRTEDGSVGGIFTAITETTAHVVGDRRLGTLRELGARGPAAKSAEQACQIAAEVLSVNRLDVPFALFYLISPDGRTAEFVIGTGVETTPALAPARVSLDADNGDDRWGFRDVTDRGGPLVRTQLTAAFGSLSRGPWPEPTETAVVLPMTSPGELSPFGFIVCGVSPRRPLDTDYHRFLGLVASQVSATVSNARAYAEERRRAEALTELDRAKTDFFSNVSHAFRTPLTLILGPLEELLAEKNAEALPAEAREQVEVAHRNSLRLLKLVNALLDFSRLEAGRMEAQFEAIDLPTFTTELVAVFRSAFEKAGLQLIVQCEPSPQPAYVDRDMWEKIVFNLLSNALKFTLRGEVEVTLRCPPDAFELRVRDTGFGIPPEHQAEVFRRFHRLKHSQGGMHEGTGIGLSLVQDFAQLHGGNVTLTSALNAGTIVTVAIPAGKRDSESVPPASAGARPRSGPGTTIQPEAFAEESLRWIPREETAAAAEQTRPVASSATVSQALPRVLLADDNADMRDFVTRLLSGRYDVAAVADGNAALALVRQWQPDLVLADVMMPGLDGFSLLRALRAEPKTQQIPVILLSARAGEEARVEGLEAGADDYLTKPFGAREMLARVKSHLHLAELRRNAEAKVTATEARLAQLVAILPAGVYAVDAGGRITFFNARAAQIWGTHPNSSSSYADFAAAFKIIGPDGAIVPVEQRPMRIALREARDLDMNEVLMERPDGTRFYANFSIAPAFDAAGAVSGAIAVFQDVTAERTARTALRETEERFRAVFQQASVGIIECDLQGRILRCNPALSRLVGYSEEELRAMNVSDLAAPEELATNLTLATRLLRREVPSFTGGRRYRRKDGSTGWLDVFATPILDASGAPAYGLAMLVDITERIHAEAGLRETEERFRAAADNAPVLIWIADTVNRRTWFNKPWLDFIGRGLQQELGRDWIHSVHPEDRDRAISGYLAAAAAREPFRTEHRLRRHDGMYRWMLVHGVPRHQGQDFIGYIGSCIDITDRRLAEEAIQESRNAERARRQELEVITQLAPAGIWMARDRECQDISANAAAYAMMRISPGQDLSRPENGPGNTKRVGIFQNGRPVPVDDLPLRLAARTGQSVLNSELEFRFNDGTSTWAYGSATPLLDESGVVRGVICVMVDITERKHAEAALRQNEEQLRLVTDHASVFIARIDRELRYRFVNRSYAQRYGRQPDELVGRHIAEIAGPRAYAEARAQMAQALAGQRVEFEMEISLPGREPAWGSVAFVPERGADGAVVGFVAVLADITARKRAELELERARDEAVAASRAKDDFLAALSHELRTPLSPVLLLASDAASDPKLPPSVRADFETIRKSVELEARLIDDLLDLTRIVRDKIALDVREVDVAVVLRDALVTVRAEFEAKRIGLVLDLAPEIQLVAGDPVRLQQVFWNVLKNAVKFTPEGGRVTIRTRPDRTRQLLVVEVADTGIGLTTGEIARVFEAFSQGDHAGSGGSHRFGGLGLGLAISRRIVELHHGVMTAHSTGRGCGAVFRIELPLSPQSESAGSGASSAQSGDLAPARREDQPAPAVSKGRVLLVEDHTPTRTALSNLLTRRHYVVVAAATAAEARAFAEQSRFDLLISDIGLPDGSGYDLMREFRERYGLKGLALTGYGMEDDIARSQRAGFLLHLTKPVRVQHLDEALTRLRLAGES